MKKVRALYRVLYSEISDKACYEKKLLTYEEILEKKGMDRDSFEHILEQYIDKTDIAVEKSKDFIDTFCVNDFKKRININKALNQVFIELSSNKVMKQMEMEIATFIKSNLDTLPDTDMDIIKTIHEIMVKRKPIEMSEDNVTALVILSLERFEEGLYE